MFAPKTKGKEFAPKGTPPRRVAANTSIIKETTMNLTEDQKQRIARLDALRKLDGELRNDLGHKLHGRVLSLRISFQVFDDNLKTFLDWTAESNQPKLYKLINDTRNDAIQKKYLISFTRHLHNLLASAKTLIDHTVVVKDELKAIHPEFGEAYKSKATECFRDYPLARFIKDFRSYILHVKLVNFHIEYILDPNVGVRPKYLLNIDSLKTWDQWSAPSRRFIENLAKNIAIQDIFIEYKSKILPFYTWFNEAFAKCFSNELLKANNLIETYNSLVEESDQ